ncbi:hypothetical protein PIB30_030409 [Stylosanthes scabra]|uniref:Uncharacterized protein n=1 Tax=Stylosanthes scabra TaxID=79078 RepID=A0ABU6Z979_9FABA|nr:hypothetical protein [Stylosanthes scabra]
MGERKKLLNWGSRASSSHHLYLCHCISRGAPLVPSQSWCSSGAVAVVVLLFCYTSCSSGLCLFTLSPTKRITFSAAALPSAASTSGYFYAFARAAALASAAAPPFFLCSEFSSLSFDEEI